MDRPRPLRPFVLESQLNRDRSSNRFMSRNVRVAPGLLVGNVASTAAAIAAALRQDALGIVSPRDRR